MIGEDPEPAVAARHEPEELAATARRTWHLPAVAVLRDHLLAEVDVYGHASPENGNLALTAGVADALAVGADGRPTCVIDWKSDREPAEDTVAAYREQLGEYLGLTGIGEGLPVFMTAGHVETICITDPVGPLTEPEVP